MADLRVAAGPGFELADKDVTVDGMTTTKQKVFFVLVTRANYDFRFGNVSLSPTVGIDLIGETETNIVYGLAFGFGF